jgi:phosphoglycolate phosphatase-like HAD superfamily hydrolase
MIKLVAFDWNGTLLADTEMIVEATNYAFRHFGYKPISLTQYRKTYTIPVVDFWLANGGKKEDMAIEHQIFYYNYYDRSVNKVKLRHGTKRLLVALHKLGVECLIYSNHTVDEIIHQLKQFGIEKYFTAVLARKGIEDQVHLHQKHKGQKLSDYLKGRCFKSSEVISVGDTCEEVEIGKGLKAWTVAITGGKIPQIGLNKVDHIL